MYEKQLIESTKCHWAAIPAIVAVLGTGYSMIESNQQRQEASGAAAAAQRRAAEQLAAQKKAAAEAAAKQKQDALAGLKTKMTTYFPSLMDASMGGLSPSTLDQWGLQAAQTQNPDFAQLASQATTAFTNPNPGG